MPAARDRRVLAEIRVRDAPSVTAASGLPAAHRSVLPHDALLSSGFGPGGAPRSRPDTQRKKLGMNSTAMSVEASIPPSTPTPIERRAAAPAPVESASGSTPSTNANEV